MRGSWWRPRVVLLYVLLTPWHRCLAEGSLVVVGSCTVASLFPADLLSPPVVVALVSVVAAVAVAVIVQDVKDKPKNVNTSTSL